MSTIEQIIEAVETGLKEKDYTAVSDILKAAFVNPNHDEKDLATICLFILKNRILNLSPVFGEFSRRFPESIYPYQAFYAEYLTMTERYDASTEEARTYIRKAHEGGLTVRDDLDPVLRLSIAQAFACVQSSYVEAGARTYCRRILDFAKSLPALKQHRADLERQLALLDTEMKDSEIQKLDAKWEGFFRTGAFATELMVLCRQKGFLQLGARVELLEAAIACEAAPKFEEEFLKSIHAISETDHRRRI